MDIQRINLHTSVFNDITHYIESDNGKENVEEWFARKFQSVLGYVRWENFTVAIGRAVESCKSLNINVDDHFRKITKMVHWVVAQNVKSRTICSLALLADEKKAYSEELEIIRNQNDICHLQRNITN